MQMRLLHASRRISKVVDLYDPEVVLVTFWKLGMVTGEWVLLMATLNLFSFLGI